MHRRELFFLLNGAIVAIGLIAFFLRFRSQSYRQGFKENLWEKIPERPEIAAKVDQLAIEGESGPLLLQGPRVKTEASSHQAKQSPFRAPKFDGAPHEVLGLLPNPTRKQIQDAYRYWIKRYHPDRVSSLGREHIAQAQRRTVQLTRARQHLLQNTKS